MSHAWDMPTPHEWLKAIGATDSLRDIAARSGVSHATLSRQIAAGRFLMDTAIELARAYGVSPVSALVSNGHITPDEAGFTGVEIALQSATDEELIVEVGRRLGVAGASTLFDAPVSDAVRAASNVVSGKFGVGGSNDDEPGVKQPPAKQRTAARKGTRKADSAPHAD